MLGSSTYLSLIGILRMKHCKPPFFSATWETNSGGPAAEAVRYFMSSRYKFRFLLAQDGTPVRDHGVIERHHNGHSPFGYSSAWRDSVAMDMLLSTFTKCTSF